MGLVLFQTLFRLSAYQKGGRTNIDDDLAIQAQPHSVLYIVLLIRTEL